MNGFQKFLRVVDGHEKCDLKTRPQYEEISKIPSQGWQAWNNWFSILTTFFAPVIFWSFFKISWIKKMAGVKKVIKVKNQFFHACQPCKEIFEICIVYSHFFTRDSNCSHYSNFRNECPKLGIGGPENMSLANIWVDSRFSKGMDIHGTYNKQIRVANQ